MDGTGGRRGDKYGAFCERWGDTTRTPYITGEADYHTDTRLD